MTDINIAEIGIDTQAENLTDSTCGQEAPRYTGYATYNICTDKFQVFTLERFSDADKKQAREDAKFQWWPGRRCWAAKWSTQAEDFILHTLGLEIEYNHEADDVEVRAERFLNYADNAAETAEQTREYLHERANTARRQRLATNKLIAETSKAEYWSHRVVAAIAHAEAKERPGAISRRIAELEKSERKYTKGIEKAYTDQLARYVIKGTDNKYYIKPEDKAKAQADAEKIKAEYQRRLDHTQMRLAYERALYAASGGLAADTQQIVVGGAIKVCGDWRQVTKVNPKTIVYLDPSCQRHWTTTRDKISDIMTPDQWSLYCHGASASQAKGIEAEAVHEPAA